MWVWLVRIAAFAWFDGAVNGTGDDDCAYTASCSAHLY